ncbi:MAG: hypothetical protein A2Z99_00895 [Treponema sp. GWB1_62_6]|nr:MAG: hypothetical protein A2Z99_00895 [Treponema sp. GWB1_62_6]OHE63329.1 MAG: hypothetical protein A2001_11450 [Treponema sp. GWC1_61_84]OHE68967.1 MAG: hypothetical protein A2413_14745 [Treponema sp. RIFOXYC1_FULL_61_9]HCM26293.1 hypothetical protein [Treponema sp.]
MFDILYGFFRASTGFTLVVVGAGFFAWPRKKPAHRDAGCLFICVGALFLLSATDSWLRLPLDPGNLLLCVLIFFLSQALVDLGLYMFGGEKRKGWRRKAFIGGAIWSAVIWLATFLDQAFGLAPLTTSVEETTPLAFFHAIFGAAIYLQPIAAVLTTAFIARWNAGDLPLGKKGARIALAGLAGIGTTLILIVVSVAAESRAAYRIAHTLLEFLMIAFYYYLIARPEAFHSARTAIGKTHERKLAIGREEEALIRERLARVVAEKRHLGRADLDSVRLAKMIGIPPYRLSHFFNACMKTSFPNWLNGLRIEHVRERMAAESDRKIIDIAMEAGYSSKSVFNRQFMRIVGSSPNEYRKKLKSS